MDEEIGEIEERLKLGRLAIPSYRPFDIVTIALSKPGGTYPFVGSWSVWLAPDETKSLTVPVPDGYIKVPLAIDYEVYTERKIYLRWWRDDYKNFMIDPQLTNFSYNPPFPFIINRSCGVEATNTDDKDNWLKVRFSGVHVDEDFWEEQISPFIEKAR